MTLEWQHDLDVAIGAVRDAARLACDIRRHSYEPAFSKTDRSPVTVADFAVQALVAHRLGQSFPGDPLVAEEDSAPLRTPDGRLILHAVRDVLGRAVPDLAADEVLEAIDRGRGTPGERFWTLDPVDGTRGFLRGDQFAVALALIVHGRVELGVLGCPRLSFAGERRGPVGSIVYAVRHHGAFRVPLVGGDVVPLRVSACRDSRNARVLRSVEGAHIDVKAFDDVTRTLGVETAAILMDSQAKHAAVAAGDAEVILRLPAARDYRESIWDQAAGAIAIEEAGGRVTDMWGRDLDFGAGRTLARNEGMVGSNGHLHAVVVEAIRTAPRVFS